MKTFLLFCLLLLLCSFDPASIGSIHITLVAVLLFIIGLYDLIIRIIPTVGNYSVIAFLIKILKIISDFLNNKKA